jgi:hypothetical protein
MVTRIQGNARGSSAYGTTAVANLTSVPTEGNVLIAVVGAYSYRNGSPTTYFSTVTSTNTTWTYQVRKGYDKDVDNHVTAEIWVGIPSASAGQAITATFPTNDNAGAVIDVCEYSGILTSLFLDKTAVNGASSGTTTDTGTTDTTTQTDELWIGATGIMYNEVQSTPTNSFTLLDGAGRADVFGLAMLEKIVSGTGTANSGTSHTNSSGYAGAIATFKATATSHTLTVNSTPITGIPFTIEKIA